MTSLSNEISRRSALTATTAVVGTGLLAACGGGDDAPAAKKVDISVDASNVPVGGGFIDRTNSVVVTQPTKGSYKAFSSVCPHQGCQVGQVTEEAIVCTCHGSRFDRKKGDVTAGPAEKGLPAKQVAVQGAKLHVTG